MSTPEPLTLPATDDLGAWGAFLDNKVLGGLEEARGLVAVLRETPAGDAETLLRWNDLHVVLGNAFAVAGLLSQVHPDAELRERAEAYEQQLHELRTALMLDQAVYAVLEAAPTDGLPAGAVVPAICRAVLAFMEEDYRGCARILEPVAGDVVRIGGSGAQREVIEDTLLVALMRGGEAAKARALLDKRLQRRPSPRDSQWSHQLPAELTL